MIIKLGKANGRSLISEPPSINFIHSLVSDGTACVVCPHVHQDVNDAKIRIVVRPPDNIGSTSPLRDKNIWGYSKNDSLWLSNNYNPYDGRAGVKRVAFQWYVINGMKLQLDWQDIGLGSFHEFITTKYNNQITLSIDGVQKLNQSVSGTPVQGRFGILTQNDIDGDAVNPIAGRTPADTAIAEFDEWDGSVLVTSLRPCIDPNNVVCFYDLVSQQYIYSVTGGSFSQYD